MLKRVAHGSGTILVVEDDDDARTIMSMMLEFEGHQVDTARSAAEALDRMRRREYDLVITDYMLPDLTGTGLLRRARKAGLLDRTRVLLATAHPEPEPFEDAPIMQKPLDFDEFLDRVRIEGGSGNALSH